MKKIIILFMSIVLLSCGTSKKVDINDDTLIIKYADKIKESYLKDHLNLLANDVFEGRKTGEKGQKLAANYIAGHYKHLGIKPPKGYDNYFQEIPKEFFNKNSNSTSENVVAFIPGSEFPDEVIVVSAHYDHLGKNGEIIYNGADDNASGTSAVMEIAKALQNAKNDGYGPKRSILFLNLTGEEEGLFGSKYYTSHPIFPLANTIVNLNIDMIGRIDKKHKNNPNYIYLIGSDKLSRELHYISEDVNKKYTKLKLDYTFNDDKDPNRYYYRSDHYNFAKNNIPVIFYFNGIHEDYHKPSDTADKINFEILSKRTQLIFYTVWEIANRENRLIVD